jgi:hypothetical protein
VGFLELNVRNLGLIFCIEITRVFKVAFTNSVFPLPNMYIKALNLRNLELIFFIEITRVFKVAFTKSVFPFPNMHIEAF